VSPFDLANRSEEIERLERTMSDPDFWNDRERAEAVSRRLAALKKPIERYSALRKRLEDARVLLELAQEESDAGVLDEVAEELESLRCAAGEFEIEALLSGRYDPNSAIVALHPGAGGTESQDWADMLMRMYCRWAESRGFEVQVLDLLEGEEAGIKSATLLVRGENAYGFLKAEKGVHRLVRISPFDASGRRHTSFASVDVLPEVEGEDEVEISPDDLKVETFRASGAGGQHVNKTESAVRITHLPTGLVVSCQKERSQHSNRNTAMKILRSKLIELQEAERRREIDELRGDAGEIAWGNQIRSYVFQPYTLVKDHRTNVEVGNVQAVMDGDIDRFIYACLQKSAAAEQESGGPGRKS